MSVVPKPRTVDDVPHLYGLESFGLSIESARLKLRSGDKDRHIYGDIHIGGGRYGKAYILYHRKSDQTDEISSEHEGDLSLCGPPYFVGVEETKMIYVNLHEGGSPFLQATVPLSLDDILYSEKINESFAVEAIGEKGDLTIAMTTISPSILTKIYAHLLDPTQEWLVSGSVTAVQTLAGGQNKRSVTLFRRSESEACPPAFVDRAKVTSDIPIGSQAIPLDRQVVLAPVHLEEEVVDKINKMLLENDATALDPNPLVNGVDSCITVDVDLKFVGAAADSSNTSCSVKGAFNVELKGSHLLGTIYDGYMEGLIKPQKRKFLCPDDDKLRIKLMVHTWNDLSFKMTEQVFEKKLPLYNLLQGQNEKQEGACSAAAGGEPAHQ